MTVTPAQTEALNFISKQAQEEGITDSVKVTRSQIEAWAEKLPEPEQKAIQSFLESDLFKQMDAGDGIAKGGVRAGLLSDDAHLAGNLDAMSFLSKNAQGINTNGDAKITRDEVVDFLGKSDADGLKMLQDYINLPIFKENGSVFRLGHAAPAAPAGQAQGGPLGAPPSQNSTRSALAPAAGSTPAAGPAYEADGAAGGPPAAQTRSNVDLSGVPLNLDGISGLKSTGTPGAYRTDYPQGSGFAQEGNKGGFNKDLSPPEAFPARSVNLHYEFKPDAGFDWAKGGKLPGLKIGVGDASGYKHSDTAASVRLMWRENGELVAYVYRMDGTDNPQFDPNEQHGQDFPGQPPIFMKAGDWNDINVNVTLNTFTNGVPNNDGSATITLGDNPPIELKGIQWTNDENTQITEAMVATFFGGPDLSPQDQGAEFRNFSAARLA